MLREKGNGSFLMRRVASDAIMGGCTFRVIRLSAKVVGAPLRPMARFRSTPTHALIPLPRLRWQVLAVEVLLIAIAQEAGVCGHGLGTALVNACKLIAHAFKEASCHSPLGV
jgi:hypothetical protein